MRASVIVISMLLATPAMAGSSQGSGASMPIGVEGNGSAYVEPVTQFAPAAHSTAVVVSPGVTQAQVEAEAQRLRVLRRQSYSGTTCASDFLSPDQAAFCWAGTVPSNNGASTIAHPIGASAGGSD